MNVQRRPRSTASGKSAGSILKRGLHILRGSDRVEMQLRMQTPEQLYDRICGKLTTVGVLSALVISFAFPAFFEPPAVDPNNDLDSKIIKGYAVVVAVALAVESAAVFLS